MKEMPARIRRQVDGDPLIVGELLALFAEAEAVLAFGGDGEFAHGLLRKWDRHFSPPR
jgi:hypothetical protein